MKRTDIEMIQLNQKKNKTERENSLHKNSDCYLVNDYCNYCCIHSVSSADSYFYNFTANHFFKYVSFLSFAQ